MHLVYVCMYTRVHTIECTERAVGASGSSRVCCKSVRGRKSRVDINSFIAARLAARAPGQFLTFPLTASLYRVLTILGDMRSGITEASEQATPSSLANISCKINLAKLESCPER